jgi:AraC-like DNA-binding protein
MQNGLQATSRNVRAHDAPLGSVPCSIHLATLPTSIYREYGPLPAFRRHLVCAWTLEIAAGTRRHHQRVLPDGCADIVWIGDAPPIVVGPMTRSAISTSDAGTTLVGLRLRPDAGARVLGVSAHEVVDRHVRLDQLWRRQEVSDASERLLEARTAAARVAAAQSLLASRQDEIGSRDSIIANAVSLLTAAERVDRIATVLGISERHLRRRFVASVGYSPKTFQRILRFQKLLAIARAHSSKRLDQVALLAGYADQAHMTREVGQFAAVTPSALLGNVVSALALSDLLARV